ncbi:elongation factor P hydroxylase [Chromohalobacter sp. 48-RD10]|uniref:elongation factor P hydroxylase n=1 Tax=Chromohalobacter sp. 48-RD10 TaxID=2994063 RepID=UPI002468B969|nr:elongation factor P hydroxylase [Chromohalobacter sp. 48-RD10]
MTHRIDDVITVFDGIFAASYRTCLVSGDDEPLYCPADSKHVMHRIIFAHGFFASALHEVSHWCIAGERRRQLEDYGYWYAPDGRDEARQREFESVEIAPQALESLFSEACDLRFNVSVDNLGGIEVDRHAFAERVAARAARYRETGLPLRAAAFREALHAFYRRGLSREAAIAEGRACLDR